MISIANCILLLIPLLFPLRFTAAGGHPEYLSALKNVSLMTTNDTQEEAEMAKNRTFDIPFDYFPRDIFPPLRNIRLGGPTPETAADEPIGSSAATLNDDQKQQQQQWFANILLVLLAPMMALILFIFLIPFVLLSTRLWGYRRLQTEPASPPAMVPLKHRAAAPAKATARESFLVSSTVNADNSIKTKKHDETAF